MTQQIIGVGAVANDGSGDPLRTAFTKINENFTEIYNLGAPGSNLDLSGNQITATNSNGDIELAPAGTGKIIVIDDSITINTSQTPATDVGVDGDTMGMIAWDASYIYVCTADYDGSTSIWRRATLASGW